MTTLRTARGTIAADTLPERLAKALVEYDRLRETYGWDAAEVAAHGAQGGLERLSRGLRRLTFRGVCRVATKHSHVCPVYVRGHLRTLTTLQGLFWWNDGGSTVRERLLRLAWEKGART